MKKLPKTLWAICLFEGTRNEYISVGDSQDIVEDGTIVGEYTLKATYKKRVLHQLDAQMKKK